MVQTNSRGYHGYQVKPEYTTGSMNILPENPQRPQDYSLSVCYTHESVPGYNEAFNVAARLDTFPGQHTYVDERR